MSMNLSSGDAVILGGTNPGGYEERPELRYETTDKSGVMTVTAVLSRKIHCLAKNADAIKQSAAFPGQIVEVNGTSYGAGWEVASVNVVPVGPNWSVVQIEARRDGVTPFEWSLPPGLSVSCENGVARILYTPSGGSAIEMLRFDSQSGENRYGWRVEYVNTLLLQYGNSSMSWRSVPVYSCRIYYENRKQFDVDGQSSLAALSIPVDWTERYRWGGNSGHGYETESEALAAGNAALAGWIAGLKAAITENVEFDNYAPTRFVSGIRSIDEDTAAVSAARNGNGMGNIYIIGNENRWHYILTVASKRLQADVDGWIREHAKGLHWESVTDTDSNSQTYQHVFYRLRYGGTVLFAIDITAATPPPE